jgi:surfeit locus 1 family protein
MRGHFDLEHQVLLHNQKYKERPGFLVYAPFLLKDSKRVVLVTRGWIPLKGGLQQLPELPGEKGLVQIEGKVTTVPSVGLKSGLPDAGKMGWPRAVTYMEMSWISRETGYKLEPYTVLQEGEKGFGLIRDWGYFSRGGQKMPPEKHRSYAFQWFSLAFTLCVIFLVVNLQRGEQEN